MRFQAKHNEDVEKGCYHRLAPHAFTVQMYLREHWHVADAGCTLRLHTAHHGESNLAQLLGSRPMPNKISILSHT